MGLIILYTMLYTIYYIGIKCHEEIINTVQEFNRNWQMFKCPNV